MNVEIKFTTPIDAFCSYCAYAGTPVSMDTTLLSAITNAAIADSTILPKTPLHKFHFEDAE